MHLSWHDKIGKGIILTENAIIRRNEWHMMLRTSVITGWDRKERRISIAERKSIHGEKKTKLYLFRCIMCNVVCWVVSFGTSPTIYLDSLLCRSIRYRSSTGACRVVAFSRGAVIRKDNAVTTCRATEGSWLLRLLSDYRNARYFTTTTHSCLSHYAETDRPPHFFSFRFLCFSYQFTEFVTLAKRKFCFN